MMKPKLFVERGQALILIALAAIGLFAIAGLAIDGSVKYADRRHAQNAADAASLAGALAKIHAQQASPALTPAEIKAAMELAALNSADKNGYDGNFVTNQVWVYSCNDIDPTSPDDCGPYQGNANYVQVVIVSYVDTYFARVIGINRTVNSVQAVALSRKGGPLGDGAMIISYDPDPNCSGGVGSGGGSVDVSGSGTLNLHGGGIFLNSDETCGYYAPNCPDINITGGAGINSVAGVDNIAQKDLGPSCPYSPVPENYIADPVIIPHDIEMPEVPIECSQLATAYNDPPGSDTWHITPGYYVDFPQANINGNIVGIKKHIIMDPGIYCVGKDIKWSGQTFTFLDGSSGVTLYLLPGADFDLNINSPIKLYASHSGSEYDGYIIIQNGTHTSIGSCSMNGGSYLDIEGTVFAPYCDITVNGGSEPTAEINAQLVGWDIKLTGNNIINFNYDPSKVAKTTRRAGLVR